MGRLIHDIFAKSNKEDEELRKEVILLALFQKSRFILTEFSNFFPKETLTLIFFFINI